MGDPRFVTSAISEANNSLDISVTTYQRDEHNFEGSFGRAQSSLLQFSGNPIAGSTLRRLSGPIAGAPGGHPICLVYWGSWWKGPGISHRAALDQQLGGLMKSVYFDQLKQYGIPHAPNLGCSVIVTDPEPPINRGWRALSKDVVGLIDDLLDDNNLPDHTGKPKPLYMVLMPDTFTLNTPAGGGVIFGAHADYPRYGIVAPISGRFWVGWTRSEPGNPDQMVQTLSHEIVETLTDPEADGWRWVPTSGLITEMSDGLVGETAFVNKASVQSYWSNSHRSSIIPIDNDYRARLRVFVVEDGHKESYEGTFVPGPEGAPMCRPSLPECCYGDRTFKWTRFAVDETAKVRLVTGRYREPVVSWKINDAQLLFKTSGQVTVSVDLTTFDNNRKPSVKKTAVDLQATLVPSAGPGIPPSLNISSTMEGNFSVQVKATVTEGAITGVVTSGMPTAECYVDISFNGSRIVFEDAYIRAVSQCHSSLVALYNVNYLPVGEPGDRPPIDEISALVLEQGLQGYVRPDEYQRIRDAIKTLRVAETLFPPEQVSQFARSLVMHIPALHALDVCRDTQQNVDEKPTSA